MKTNELKQAIREELQARGKGNLMAVATLVEDYGVATKEALLELWRAGEVVLVPTSLLAQTAKQYGYTMDEMRRLSIPGVCGELRASRVPECCTCGDDPDRSCCLCSGAYDDYLEALSREAEWDVAEVRAAEELALAAAEGEPWM